VAGLMCWLYFRVCSIFASVVTAAQRGRSTPKRDGRSDGARDSCSLDQTSTDRLERYYIRLPLELRGRR